MMASMCYSYYITHMLLLPAVGCLQQRASYHGSKSNFSHAVLVKLWSTTRVDRNFTRSARSNFFCCHGSQHNDDDAMIADPRL
jgi:hypothetical protein